MSQVITSIKLGLIPLLALVLYFLVRGDSTPKPTNAPPVDASPVLDSPTRPVGASAALAIPARTQWPEIRFEQIAGVDPFDRRMIFPVIEPVPVAQDASEPVGQSLVNATGSAPPSTEALKVQIVFQTSAGIGAMVGDRIVRIGDTLDDGRRVVAITPDSLVLSSVSVH